MEFKLIWTMYRKSHAFNMAHMLERHITHLDRNRKIVKNY